MDNFMDKLVQRFNSQEIIKANAAAEEMEMKKQQMKIEEYEKILQEMRQVNLKSAEISEQIKQASAIDFEIKEQIQAQLQTQLQQDDRDKSEVKEEIRQSAQTTREMFERTQLLISEMIQKMENKPEEKADFTQLEESIQRLLEENKNATKSLFTQMEDYIHRENVKVYRNVQAVVEDGFHAREEADKKVAEETGKSFKGVKGLLIAAIILMVGNFAAAVVFILQFLGMF